MSVYKRQIYQIAESNRNFFCPNWNALLSTVTRASIAAAGTSDWRSTVLLCQMSSTRLSSRPITFCFRSKKNIFARRCRRRCENCSVSSAQNSCSHRMFEEYRSSKPHYHRFRMRVNASAVYPCYMLANHVKLIC